MMHSPAVTLLILTNLLTANLLFCQSPTIDDFTMIGDTYRTDDECFRLTEEEDYSSGSIWYKRPINLAESFSVDLTMMFGCQNETGADGMVFVMTNQGNQVGWRGEGIGFAGLVPSIGIEIDTWQNYHLLDPEEDHLAIMANGQVGHYQDLAGPITIPNIEDCSRHRFSVKWNPNSQKLAVEIDDVEIISIQGDIANSIFGGNTIVYWGVTAATGRYNNFHEVCFDRLSYQSPIPFIERTPLKNATYWGQN